MTTYIPSLTLPQGLFASPAASILLPVGIGLGIGALSSPKETQRTYLAIKQPPYRPPPQVFAPVWTTLYGLMGYAAWRAWTTGSASFDPQVRALAKHGATLYTIQLGLNFIWMPLFFSARRPIEAAVDLATLTGVTAYLTYIWGQVDERAGWALAPYLAWLGVANYLNLGVGYLNGWSFEGKEKTMPPGGAADSSSYVNEKN